MDRDLRVAFITTLRHNVGDDLVREGISHLLRRTIGPFRSLLIHKHFPATAREEFAWVHDLGLTRMIDRLSGGRSRVISRQIERLPLRLAGDRILNADLLVQAGSPVYWCFPDGSGCHTNEWFSPLIERRYSVISGRVPFLNIGAGSCQPFHSDGSEFSQNAGCLSYIRKLYQLSSVTTVRDDIAQMVLRTIKLDAPLLPCPSIFARDGLAIGPSEGEFVALNFMRLGGHYDLRQNIDAGRWKDTFSSFCATLSSKVPVAMACHSRDELRIAARWFPGIPRVLLQSAAESLSFYARATFYIGSRVHGAMATASLGRPAFVIGTDTRARMASPMKIRSGFVGDMSVDLLMQEFLRMQREAGDFAATSESVREDALEGYMGVISRTGESLRKGMEEVAL